jgi:hypothetical protein
MEQDHVDTVTSLNQQTSNEWVKLLRKLRWIGLEEEARNLELVLSILRSEQRSVLAEPLGTAWRKTKSISTIEVFTTRRNERCP